MVKKAHNDEQIPVNIDLINYQLTELQKGFQRLEDKFDKQQHVPISDFDELRADHRALKLDVQQNYVKKSDNKGWRTAATTAMTAVVVAIVTLITSFALNGGFTR